MSAQTPVIEATHLTKRYGKRLALNDLNLEIAPAKVHGFLGPNGAGKTTAISLILGLISPTQGNVRLFGVDTRTTRLPALLRRVGAVLEAVAFYPHLSGRENLKISAALSGAGASRIDEALDTSGLAGRARDKVRGYSLGMRQRLAVAAALLHDPELLVLDEPTNGLDPAGMREFRQLIRRLAAAGKTVFVSSHLLSEVQQMCDEVAILKEGRLIAQGPVDELLRKRAGLELRTTDDAQAAQALAGLDWVTGVERDGDVIYVQAPADRAWELSRALAQKEIYVSQLRARESSLEDFFLEVTQEEAE